jgi:hypothetical protein
VALRARSLCIPVLLGLALLAGTVLSDTVNRTVRSVASAISLSSAMARDSEQIHTYQLLGLFGDGFERIRSEFVDPVLDKHPTPTPRRNASGAPHQDRTDLFRQGESEGDSWQSRSPAR